MKGVILTPLRRIPTVGGDILHAMKSSDAGFAGFGEVYFSLIEAGRVKGWKKHKEATLNFVVPHGDVQVSVVSADNGERETYRLGPSRQDSHVRLTIAPGLWVAFGGLADGSSALMNCSTHIHDPLEAETLPLDTYPWLWSRG